VAPVLPREGPAHGSSFQENESLINAARRDFMDLGTHDTLCHKRVFLHQRIKISPIDIVGEDYPACARLEAAHKKKSPAVEASFDPGIVSLQELGGSLPVVRKPEKYDKHELFRFEL
jgi:hypothetical protein